MTGAGSRGELNLGIVLHGWSHAHRLRRRYLRDDAVGECECELVWEGVVVFCSVRFGSVWEWKTKTGSVAGQTWMEWCSGIMDRRLASNMDMDMGHGHGLATIIIT